MVMGLIRPPPSDGGGVRPAGISGSGSGLARLTTGVEATGLEAAAGAGAAAGGAGLAAAADLAAEGVVITRAGA